MRDSLGVSADSWSLTVVRAAGFRSLRPGKPWRPVVTIAIDGHQPNEILLGSDGQNPNMKTSLSFRQAEHTTPIEIKIWHESQTKKKSRRRCLVAYASLQQRELFRKAEAEEALQIPLMAQVQTRRKAQCEANLTIKVLLPASMKPLPSTSYSYDDAYTSNDGCSAGGEASSSTSTGPSSPATENSDLPWQSLDDGSSKKPKIMGYLSGDDETDCESDIVSPQHDVDFLDESNATLVDQDEFSYKISCPDSVEGLVVVSSIPRFRTQLSVASSTTLAESILDSVSSYRDLREATVDSEFEKILSKLQSEWYFLGGTLVSLAALHAAVFGFASDSLFSVDSLARRFVALGAISSGIGVFIAAWFIFAYSGIDSVKFQRRAMDVFGTYFFFSISARMPALCMLVSAISLMGFLLCVASSAWPMAVLVMCVLAGIILSLQFIVYGLHSCYRGGKVLRGLIAAMFEKLRGSPQSVTDGVRCDTPETG